MPAAEKKQFRATLKDPDSEQRRYVTLLAKSKDEAVARLEDMEEEYVQFRLDDPPTFQLSEDDPDYDPDVVPPLSTYERYSTLPPDAHDRVMGTTDFVREDTTTEDGRFLRAGKAVISDPSGNKYDKGWRAVHEQEKPYEVVEIGESGLVAAVTGGLFGVPVKNQWDGTSVTNWSTAAIKTALFVVGLTVDIDTQDFFNDVSANEVAATGGYTATGTALGSKAATYDTATDQIRLDAADATWTSSTITARYAITYNSTPGTAATNPILSFLNFGADVATTNGTFLITWDVTGIIVYDVT